MSVVLLERGELATRMVAPRIRGERARERAARIVDGAEPPVRDPFPDPSLGAGGVERLRGAELLERASHAAAEHRRGLELADARADVREHVRGVELQRLR